MEVFKFEFVDRKYFKLKKMNLMEIHLYNDVLVSIYDYSYEDTSGDEGLGIPKVEILIRHAVLKRDFIYGVKMEYVHDSEGHKYWFVEIAFKDRTDMDALFYKKQDAIKFYEEIQRYIFTKKIYDNYIIK